MVKNIKLYFRLQKKKRLMDISSEMSNEVENYHPP